ncbi:DUF4190 domain-containing protein [Agrococcus sp. ARC_14]|uniref:DUF4190 domain-containing protein n=1 Tax=Agrococcus sp. ARC_14 TaxID=2919927 RepID=UPI001F05C16D|nr:DUF4190 domain-containing protein [Agrococcus sp. ARC_14]MCH1882049.1 DUF4190 domain-containing protein [Agrococcus sp. ARC_14]
MPSDADRFRPHDRSIAEQSPPAQEPIQQQPRPLHAAQQPAVPQAASTQQPTPRYAPPGALPAAAPYAAFDGRDAPLIHPAAAQASSLTPYGVPVYQAPAYIYAPLPARGLSITALVLGVCSFLFAWTLVVVPIIGIVFGFLALKREPAGRTLAIVGMVASAIGLLFVLLFYLLPFVAFFGALLMAAAA